MNETILLELQLKLVEAQRDVAIAERNLATFALRDKSTKSENDFFSSNTVLSRVLAILKDVGSMSTDRLSAKCNTTIPVLRVTLNRAKSKGLFLQLQKQAHSRFAAWSLTDKGVL